MIRMGQIQNCVAQQNEQLLMIAFELSAQRLITCLDNDAFPHPLPELCLSGPKLFPISANNQCRLLFPLLLFGVLLRGLFVAVLVRAHLNTPLSLHVVP